MSREEKLSQFVAWAQHNITGDEKGQAQIFLDRLFQAFGQPGVLDVGGQTEFRIRQAGMMTFVCEFFSILLISLRQKASVSAGGVFEFFAMLRAHTQTASSSPSSSL